MGKPHRATGNPRGRPPKLPFDFGLRIMENLRRRVDPKTGLVKPFTACMARRLGSAVRPFLGNCGACANAVPLKSSMFVSVPSD